jgi:hypothetical protein
LVIGDQLSSGATTAFDAQGASIGLLVMRGLDPRIQVSLSGGSEGVNGRVKPGHDDEEIPSPK